MPSVLTLNSTTEQSSLTTEEKIDWLNSKEYDKKVQVSDNDPYLLGRLVSGISLKESKSPSDENEEIKKVEIQKQESEEFNEDESDIKEQEIDTLKVECESLKGTIEEIQADIKKLVSTINNVIITEQNEAKALTAYEEQSKIKMKAYELLENGEENVKKLEEAIDTYVNKLIHLANQWEKHRSPLIAKYRDEREKHSSKAVSK